VVLTKIS